MESQPSLSSGVTAVELPSDTPWRVRIRKGKRIACPFERTERNLKANKWLFMEAVHFRIRQTCSVFKRPRRTFAFKTVGQVCSWNQRSTLVIHFLKCITKSRENRADFPYIVLESPLPGLYYMLLLGRGNNSALLPVCFSFCINEVQGSSGNPPGGQVGTARLHGARELP